MDLIKLNDKQKEAVKISEGPLLVLAGAGSGKTRVLTTKVAYLVDELGIPPTNILAITFTNKAAKEMKERIFAILGSIAYNIQISTFHSFGLLVIKENYEKLGYQSNFTILDSDDTLTLIKKIMKELNIDSKKYNPKAIRNKISSAKNELLNASEYSNYVNSDLDEKAVSIYKNYERKLKLNNSLDFDDLLTQPIILFKKNPDILKKYQEKFQYILIDEYQDTNYCQYLLVKMLSAKYKNVCVVGDESQSIYSFRGANYRNILNFEKDFSNCKTVYLEQNYRSTGNILGAANNVIKNNKEKKEKNLWTENEKGEKIVYHRAHNETDEGEYVISEINKLLSNGVTKDSIAVLYRTNAQSRSMEDAFLRNNIPYKVIGSFYFYNRKEIKDLICYLKLIYNQNDDVSLTRIINVPKRGIGDKTIANLSSKASLNGTSMFNAIEDGKCLEFKKLILELINEKDKYTLTELVDLILNKSGIKKELIDENSIESEIRLENLEEFKSITSNFENFNGVISLEDFLNEISLVSDISEHKNETDVVTLMTIHLAKGLEFDYVFLVGMEEGLFPHSSSLVDASSVEEERRLCYVAITRTKKKLWLVNSQKRLIYGESNYNPPSRFINEIGDNYLDKDVLTSTINNIKEKIIIKDEMVDSSIQYNFGDKVRHETFGVGVIVGIDKKLLTIAFSHPYGIKKMIKGHKSIKKI